MVPRRLCEVLLGKKRRGNGKGNEIQESNIILTIKKREIRICGLFVVILMSLKTTTTINTVYTNHLYSLGT